MTESAPKQTSGLAIAGLVLGILAAVTSFLPIINNLSAILAVIGGILAIIALIGALRGKHAAKGLSIAGVVLAVVSFAVVLATQSMYAAALDSALEKAKTGSTPVAATTDSGDAAAASEDAQEDASQDQQDYSNLAVGQSVQFDDGLSVTVNSVQAGPEKYDGTPIIQVNVTYANNGSDNASFNTYDWKGEDANGAQRSATYVMDSTDELSSGTLSPGGSVTGNVYFEDGIVRVLYYSNMFNSGASAGWTL